VPRGAVGGCARTRCLATRAVPFFQGDAGGTSPVRQRRSPLRHRVMVAAGRTAETVPDAHNSGCIRISLLQASKISRFRATSVRGVPSPEWTLYKARALCTEKFTRVVKRGPTRRRCRCSDEDVRSERSIGERPRAAGRRAARVRTPPSRPPCGPEIDHRRPALQRVPRLRFQARSCTAQCEPSATRGAASDVTNKSRKAAAMRMPLHP